MRIALPHLLRSDHRELRNCWEKLMWVVGGGGGWVYSAKTNTALALAVSWSLCQSFSICNTEISPDFPIILFHFWLFGVEGHMYVESFADQYYKPVCPSQTQRRLQWPPWSSSRPQERWWSPTPGTLKLSLNLNQGFVFDVVLGGVR